METSEISHAARAEAGRTDERAGTLATSHGDNDISAATRPAPTAADVLVGDRPASPVPNEDAPAGSAVTVEDDAPAPHSAQHIELPEIRLLRLSSGASRATADEGDGTLDAELPGRLRALLTAGPLDDVLAEQPAGTEEALVAAARRVAARAYPEGRVTGRQTERWIDHEARARLIREQQERQP